MAADAVVLSNAEFLSQHLASLLPAAKMRCSELLLSRPLKLWLIDPEGMDGPLTEVETSDVFEAPPFWSFCWGSGRALAQWLLDHPETVAGKTVLDFGCGSGVVAIAAVMAGAERVIACDIDPVALQAVKANAELNSTSLNCLEDFFLLNEPVDLLLAADVLYDPENLPLLQAFREKTREVIVADSRVRNFNEKGFHKIGEAYAVTEPDLGELESVKTVRFYRAAGCL